MGITELDDSDVAIYDRSWADLLHALCHWVDVDPRAHAVSDSVMQANSGRALKLDAARRSLRGRIDDARRVGLPIADLQREYDARQAQARSFLASMAAQPERRMTSGASSFATTAAATAVRRPTIARYLACVPELQFARPRTISGFPQRTTPAPRR